MIDEFEMPAVIIKRPFSLTYHNKDNLDKVRDEILDKMRAFENQMAAFYSDYNEIADSWRMISNNKSRKDKGLFDSKVGETHRAINTLATMWFRMLTSADPYVEVYPLAESVNGAYTNDELYGVREVLMEQHRELKFKGNLLKGLVSLAAFGTLFVEKPWVQLPGYMGQPGLEGTKFKPRSLLSCGFDSNISDIDESDFVYTIDYFTPWKLKSISSTEGGIWNKSIIDAVVARTIDKTQNSERKESTIYDEIITRKQRAGYTITENNVLEQISYHGKLDINNPIFEDYWEKEGRTDDIEKTDWTVGVLNGEELDRFHPTPMGTWRHMVEVAHYNQFEEEAIGYGAGRLGKRIQSELDVVMSRANDAMMMSIYSMWKMGRNSGLNLNQLNIKPFHIVHMDDVEQLQQLKIDMNSIVQGLSIQASRVEDFRSTTGATTGLQAINTNATATEASLTQSEAMRAASVAAEVIGEPLMRNFIKTQHLNNMYLLDNSIAVSIAGEPGNRISSLNKHNIAQHVGFKVKITTDRDYRPERLKRLLEMINLATSIRQIIPDSINAVEPMFKEAFRLIGLDPMMLNAPKNPTDSMLDRLQRLGKSNAGPEVMNEISGEMGGEMAGSPSFSNMQTPMGSVPVSAPGSMNIG